MVQIGDQNKQPTNPGCQEARKQKYRLKEPAPKAKKDNKCIRQETSTSNQNRAVNQQAEKIMIAPCLPEDKKSCAQFNDPTYKTAYSIAEHNQHQQAVISRPYFGSLCYIEHEKSEFDLFSPFFQFLFRGT